MIAQAAFAELKIAKARARLGFRSRHVAMAM